MTVFAATAKCCGKNVKKNWSGKIILAFWVSNGSIKLKLAENAIVYAITHNNDLEELFPGNELLLESESNDQL